MDKDMVIKNSTDLRNLIEDIYRITNKNAVKKDPFSFERERKSIINDIVAVFNQLFLNEDASYSDIEFLGIGATSYVFAVKSKVIKIGSDRYTNNIRNNPYILQPVFRKSFEFKGNILEGLFVEVVERVKTFKDINEDELYELYVSFRNIGLEWIDVEPRNVGALLKDNVINWKLPTVFENDLNGEEIHEVRKAGDLVVLDTDFIYEPMAPEEFFNCYEDEEWDFIPIVRKFRKRYEKEKSHKK